MNVIVMAVNENSIPVKHINDFIYAQQMHNKGKKMFLPLQSIHFTVAFQ